MNPRSCGPKQRGDLNAIRKAQAHCARGDGSTRHDFAFRSFGVGRACGWPRRYGSGFLSEAIENGYDQTLDLAVHVMVGVELNEPLSQQGGESEHCCPDHEVGSGAAASSSALERAPW